MAKPASGATLTALVVLALAWAFPTTTGAQNAFGTTITPNGGYQSGVNAVVVQGGGAAGLVAGQIQADSGLAVQGLWLLQSGEWRYYLPRFPSTSTAPAEFKTAPLSVFVVLVRPGRQRLVMLDPGHGGEEVGAAAYGLVEKDSNLDMARRVEKLLKAEGVSVVLTRTADTPSVLYPRDRDLQGYDALHFDLQARVDFANSAGADLFVSIHSNGSDDPGSGLEVWYDPDQPFAVDNKALAQLLLDGTLRELDRYGYTPFNRGLKDDTCFVLRLGVCTPLFVLGPPHVLPRDEVLERGGSPTNLGFAPGQDVIVNRGTRMPGALVELLFITDPDDAAVLADGAGRDALARGLAAGILVMLDTRLNHF